jgi:hypothetical protein
MRNGKRKIGATTGDEVFARALGAPSVEHELESGGLFDGDVRRVGTAQNLIHVRRRAPRDLIQVRTVAQERALARPRPPA